MTFANPAGLWLLTALIGVVALHLLRPRRSDTVVSSSMLWEADTVGATAASPWQRLTPTVSLLLQILAVVLAALALARPVIRSEAGLSDHTVVVLDASASMAATDGSPDRLAEARREAIDLWDELPDGGTLSLVVGGPRPRVAVTSTADRDAWVAAVEAVAQTDGPMDLGEAMTLADGLETAEQTIGIVLVSDGRHDDDDLRALPPGVTHRPVGEGPGDGGANRAITSLSVRPDLDADGGETGTMTAVATVEAFGGEDATVPVRFDVDGATAAVEEVAIDPTGPTTVTVEVPTGDRVVARLVGQDLLAIDDTAYAQARRAEDVTVSIEGDPDPFVEALVAALPGVRVVDQDRDLPDVSIFVGADVPADVSRPFWAIAPPSGFAGVEVAGVIENPAPTLIRTGDRLLAGLDLSTLRVAEAQRLDAPTAETLVGAEGAPLVLRGRRAGLTFVYTAFDLGRSSLPLDVAFPILGDRILQELAGSTTVPPVARVGDDLDTPAGRTSVVTDPAGNEVTIAAEGGTVTIDRPGFWTVTPDGGRPVTVAAALPPGESELGTLPVPPSEPRVARTGEEPPALDRSLRWLAILALAAVVAVEWWWWRPRAGVPRWQRRGADGLRVLGLAALALALIGFSLPLPAREVSTVFVVDRSDSLGVAGREAADRWVDDAIEARIDAEGSARSAVVASADGSRVDQLLRDRDRTNAATVIEVDGDRTDLASGLRLAGALLPDEARRRVVVLSDGRATVGDARTEAGDLARRDIPVDYVLIDEASGSDASIASIQAPGRVAEGEAVVVQAVVDATVAQPAVVTLRRNGEVVGSTEVDLEAGTNAVSLRDTPPAGGLVSYEVSVSVALDDQPRNDVGRTAVEVEGPDRVLVVASTSSTTSSASAGSSSAPSGDPARSLVRALEAASIEVDQVTPATLPGLDRLAGYRSVVLVDVDAAALSDRQMLDLVANTRDLGRGLVTIGGPQSYGMGGYRSSTLEEVLPVVSDVLDPRRRRTVAEVFALDTSESMGNCHCAENGNPSDRIPGGVTKTDIARAGTARAIDALEPDDEIGILAVDTRTTWLLDLQRIPAEEVIEAGLAKATPAGATDLRTTLDDAADQLRGSDAGLKHVILFTDGFTPLASIADLVADAEALYAEGITVSVVGTGEGSTRQLQEVAQAGGGRFYPGRDLARIPEILVQESVIASRSFINEGEFFPVVTAPSPILAGVDATPALTGFVATTAKPTATTVLVVGDEEDPLLATWRAGLGRATSWTSDAGVRWLGDWTTWDGYTDFWARLVRDTFPLDRGGSVRATVDGDRLRIRVEAPGGTEAGSAPVTAVVTDPDGRQREVELTPTGDGVHVGEVDASTAGNYAIGAATVGPDGPAGIGADLATLSYAAEYRPGEANEALLAALSEISGGRGAITPEQAFDGDGLTASPRRIPLDGWLLAVAVAAWLAALVLSRLWISGTAPALPTPSLGRPSRPSRRPARDTAPTSEPGRPERPATAPIDQAPPAPPPDPEAPPVKPTTMTELLKAKRDRGEG